MQSEAPSALISGSGIWFLWIYLGLMVVVGIFGRYAQKEESLSDFYLGGRGLGFFVLLLTIYATQYSGNTLIGFSGQAYRDGFYFLVSVGFMMGVVMLWLIYAPRLQKLSRKYNFITPGDYLQHRYNSRSLTTFGSILCLIALGNYILTNLKAVGTIMFSATGGHVPFAQAIIVAALIMVVYETLGGMRSVAWTDTIQGVLLLTGCLAIFWGVQHFYGGLAGTAQILMTQREDLWTPPSLAQKREWLSTLVMMSIGISLYPHAIQRIYAAKSAITLRKSFQVMVFMPLFTTLFMLIVGIVGASQFFGLDKAGSEGISMQIVADITSKAPWFNAVAILFICAAIAAIMSTVDSALLTISSMIAKDLYKPFSAKASEHVLVLIGKFSSWVIMALMAFLAIKLPSTIWQLIVIKLEILCQVAPAIILGLYYKSLTKQAVFSGMIAGTVLVILLMFGKSKLGLDIPDMPWNIHAGIWGLGLNLIVIWIVNMFSHGKELSTD
jgi:SSS family solute:Na+ symporter